MLTNENVFKKYSLSEMKAFILEVREYVKANRSEIENLRLKKGLYKKYREEYLPLYEYGLRFYSSNANYYYQLINGNQNYDAIITLDEKLIDRVELTFPQFGELNNSEARQLNEKGISNIRLSDNSTQLDLGNIIIGTAKNKAQKDYSGTTLVIFIDDVSEFDFTDEDDMNVINQIVSELRKIHYSSKNVYFMIMRQVIDGEEYPSKWINVK